MFVIVILVEMTHFVNWGAIFHVLIKSIDTQSYEQLHCFEKILYIAILLNDKVVATMGPKTTRVGWIGTGVMGGSMCQHLIDAGYQCTVVRAISHIVHNIV